MVIDTHLPKNRYAKEETAEYKIPIYSNSSQNEGLYGYTNIIKVSKPCITISARGTIGYIKARYKPFYPIVRLLVLVPKAEIAEIKFLEYALNKLNLKQFGVNIPQLTVPQLSQFSINLPKLNVQNKLIQKIETLETEIAAIETELAGLDSEKEAVLKNYLE